MMYLVVTKARCDLVAAAEGRWCNDVVVVGSDVPVLLLLSSSSLLLSSTSYDNTY